MFFALKGLQPHSGSCLPAREQWLIKCMSALASWVKVKTKKLNLSGLKSYQVDRGLPSTAFLDVRLERVMPGIKREFVEPGRQASSPLTRGCLLRVLRCLSQLTYKNVTNQMTFALAFACFLRVGEFTYQSAELDLGPNFRSCFLTRSGVRISRDSPGCLSACQDQRQTHCARESR